MRLFWKPSEAEREEKRRQTRERFRREAPHIHQQLGIEGDWRYDPGDVLNRVAARLAEFDRRIALIEKRLDDPEAFL